MLRLAIAFLPLSLTPVLVHGIASGAVALGGGEKDLVWVLPWLLGSLLFAGSSLVLWRRGHLVLRASLASFVVALAGVLLAALLLAAFGRLGVAGRF